MTMRIQNFLNLISLSLFSIIVFCFVLSVNANTSHMWNLWVNLMHEWIDDCTCYVQAIWQQTPLASSTELNEVDCWKKYVSKNPVEVSEMWPQQNIYPD